MNDLNKLELRMHGEDRTLES
eukprot:COSAG06_NODE_7926_length_2332_cov_1.993283_1_plen_20_part_10